MNDWERRRGPRVTVEMWVEESTERELYFYHTGTLSPGGLFLENTMPHPIGTTVNLNFTLPGDTQAINVRGEVVSTEGQGGAIGMGVRFVEMEAPLADRISKFVERGEPV